MTKGLFTSLEEVKFRNAYMAPIAHPQIKKEEKYRPLFTSPEEIRFQHDYVRGGVERFQDPNTKRSPAETAFCVKKRNKRPRVFLGRTR